MVRVSCSGVFNLFKVVRRLERESVQWVDMVEEEQRRTCSSVSSFC